VRAAVQSTLASCVYVAHLPHLKVWLLSILYTLLPRAVRERCIDCGSVCLFACLLARLQEIEAFHNKKNVWETVRKPPLAEDQSAWEIQKNTFCGMAVSVPLPKFSEKLLHHTKFHWNRAIRCWVMAKRRFSIWQPSAILNLKKNHSWSRDCYRVPNMHLGTKFCPNQMIFCWVMAILWYTIWRSPFILNFRNLEFMSRDFYCDAILLWCAKFHLNRTIGCWVMAKNDF